MKQRKSFNKSDLIKVVYKRYKSLNRIQAKRVVQCIFNSINQALSEHKRVEVRGFGTFGLKSHDARIGKNPQTGESIHIQAKKLPFFRAGKLKKDIDTESTN